jgi:hypothetical protein
LSGRFSSLSPRPFIFSLTHLRVQWPDETLIPGFRKTLEEYFAQVQQLSYNFSSLLAEAFGLPSDALRKFYGTDPNMQHRGKIVQYPVISEGDSEAQGVGPHYDAGFLTFVSHVFISGDWMMDVDDGLYSSYKHLHTRASKSRTSLVNGSTHPQSTIHSSSTSGKVRIRVTLSPCHCPVLSSLYLATDVRILQH